MRRRDFIKAIMASAAWPLAARAQQQAMPVIGYLSSRSPDDTRHLLAAFLRGLNEVGYVEGQNVSIEYRWGFGQYDRLPGMAADLVRRSVAVLTTTGGEPSALAAKAATSTVPIVFLIGGDPVELGLAASYSRPGGNATGMNILTTAMETKRLGLLHDLLPNAKNIGVLINPKFKPASTQLRNLQEAAPGIGLQIRVLPASTDDELQTAFATLIQERVTALAVTADPFFDTRRNKLVALAAQYAVPTIYQFREYVSAGGLMSYGNDPVDAYRIAGVYTGRVLKGEKPGELPVLQPTKFEFVLNRKTAKALGLMIPSGVLAIADEVID
jgi:putative tryptophan/tyrosine transport system substrate-binding protein